MKNEIGFNSVWAISAPLDEEIEIDPDSPFYEIMLGFPVSIMEGSYFYINGSWSYCPSCAYHVNIDEVTVYGSFSSNVSSYAPQNTSYSDIWRVNNDVQVWDYWSYLGGSGGLGAWYPDPIAVNNMTDFRRNSAVSSKAEDAEGKPYVPNTNGPDEFDCSGLVVYAIRSLYPNFGDYSAHDLCTLFTESTSLTPKGTLIFYDYTSDGHIDHVTVVIGGGEMIHPSSGAGYVMKVPTTYLDSYTEGQGGTKYYRQIDWTKVMQE
jgi:hypothetical protein